MKKLKSIIIFMVVLAAMAILFCLSASAAEWTNLSNYTYSFDEDTGVMVIRDEGATVGTHDFGYTSTYCNVEGCLCWEYFPDNPPSENDLKSYDAAEKTKILIIENGITDFQNGALCHFENVETIIFPETVTEIPDGLCYSLDNLRTVILPSGLTEIGREAFAYCRKLTNVRIPDSVKLIDYMAFYAVDTSVFIDHEKIETVREGNKTIPDCLESVKVNTHSDSVGLRWDSAEDASGYRVFIHDGNKWKKLVDTSREYYSINGLESNKEYTFAVRPYHKLDGKAYWAPKYIKVVVTTALEDVTAKASSTSTGAAKVSWNNIASEDGYQIWISEKENSGYKKVSNYKSDTISATVKNLKSNKIYYVKVRAYKKVSGGYNYSEFSNIIAVKIK